MPTEISAGPTVGREPELEQIEAALGALAASASACVAIEGEPGIGKTRLLAKLRRRADDGGCLVLAGVAAEFERDLLFSVWADALDAYVVSQQLDLHAIWPAEVVVELAEILPSLRPQDPSPRIDWPTSATEVTGRYADCSSYWPRTGRSCSCSRSTTCTGATQRRSS